MLKTWTPIAIGDEWRARLLSVLLSVQDEDKASDIDRTTHIQTQLGSIKARLSRLIDAFVDGTLDKDSFEERKRTLVEEERSLSQALTTDMPDSARVRDVVMERLELASSAQQSYRLGNVASKRELAILLCSNRSVAGKDVVVEPSFPFAVLEERVVVSNGAHSQYRARTVKRLARQLLTWGEEELRRIELGTDRPKLTTRRPATDGLAA